MNLASILPSEKIDFVRKINKNNSSHESGLSEKILLDVEDSFGALCIFKHISENSWKNNFEIFYFNTDDFKKIVNDLENKKTADLDYKVGKYSTFNYPGGLYLSEHNPPESFCAGKITGKISIKEDKLEINGINYSPLENSKYTKENIGEYLKDGR